MVRRGSGENRTRVKHDFKALSFWTLIWHCKKQASRGFGAILPQSSDAERARTPFFISKSRGGERRIHDDDDDEIKV